MSNLNEALLEVIQECEAMIITLRESSWIDNHNWEKNAKIRGIRASLRDACEKAKALQMEVN